ncbi:MAG: hypothetical protein HY247_06140 [archaeon]|nr:MAG: hypothetical protein HY247_06140 [archaeon]
MDDLITAALIVSSGFFVALSVALLGRYREASRRISTSTNLGRDLWSSLEQRLKRQDERIVDLMARLEVVQVRVINQSPTPKEMRSIIPSRATQQMPQMEHDKPTPAAPQVATSSPAPERIEPKLRLDKYQRQVLEFLAKGAKSTIDVKEALGNTREHNARVLKELFDRGLVTRDDTEKPFVYSLSEEGKKYFG